MALTKPPQIFSKSRRAAAWYRMLARQQLPDRAEYLLRDAIDDMIERIDFMQLEPRTALVIGDWTGLLATTLEARGTAVDSVAIGELDEEAPFSGNDYDLVLHLLGLGSVNDLPGALVHARNALADGGIVLAEFPGAGSLPVLREVMLEADGDRPAPRIHPQVDNQAAASLLQRAGFRRQVVDSHSLRVRFGSLSKLVSDLRDHALGAVLRDAGPALTRASLKAAEKAFEARKDSGGRVAETFEMLTLTGWKS